MSDPPGRSKGAPRQLSNILPESGMTGNFLKNFKDSEKIKVLDPKTGARERPQRRRPFHDLGASGACTGRNTAQANLPARLRQGVKP